jgi:hypothetical protein
MTSIKRCRQVLLWSSVTALIATIQIDARQTQTPAGSENIVYVSVFVDVKTGASLLAHGRTWPVTTLLGLTISNFRIYENGVRQNIAYLSPSMSRGTTGIVVGLSSRGPVKAPVKDDPVFADITSAVKTITAHSGDGSFVATVPWNSDGIYEVVTHSIARLQQQADPRKALIVISDGAIPGGVDTVSTSAEANLIEAAKRADFPIYFISVVSGQTFRPRSGGAYSVSRTLQIIAESTGGAVFRADPHGGVISPSSRVDRFSGTVPAPDPRGVFPLCTVSSQLIDKLNRRYILGYSSTNQNQGGKQGKISVKVNPPRGTQKISVDVERKNFVFTPPSDAREVLVPRR